MSRTTPSPSAPPAEDNTDFFLRVEQEYAAGYLEVEAQGLTIDQFFAVYTLVVRSAVAQTVAGIRSLFRMDTAAHS